MLAASFPRPASRQIRILDPSRAEISMVVPGAGAIPPSESRVAGNWTKVGLTRLCPSITSARLRRAE
jgi:hypothetical protein